MSLKKKMQEMLAKRPRISELQSNGAEKLDPTPLFIGVGLRKPPTQEQRFKALLESHRLKMEESSQYFDETDFTLDDDVDMLTRYEHNAQIYEMEPFVPEQTSQVPPAPPKPPETPQAPPPPSGA